MLRRSRLLLATVLAPLFASAAPVPQIPVETLFRKPEFSALSLSPDGKYIGALAPVKNRMNLHVIEVATMKPVRVTTIDQDLNGYVWKTNDRLLFTMDKSGNESLGLYAVNRDGSGLATLAAPAESQIKEGSNVIRQTQILDLLKGRPDEILVEQNDRLETVTDVYVMNVRTGRKRRAVLNPGKVGGWLTDHAGVVRIAVAVDGLKQTILYRPNEKVEWSTLGEFEYPSESWGPLAFDYDNRTLFIGSNVGRDRMAVYRYDTETRQRGDLIYGHDLVDVAGVALYDYKKKPLYIGYLADKPKRFFLDQEEAALQQMVDEALPDTFNTIIRARDNPNVALVAAGSDRHPGTYYFLDIANNKLRYLLSTREWIDPKQMADMKPISFTARDGLTLHGYLTLPVGSDGRNVPLIVSPHGGPQARDAWGFQSDVQFLANRGFAVLQVNFRGSTGYGLNFMKAGFREWGRKMQDDLTDGVKWAIAQGIAKPDAIGIYGGSYGGYATLAGLTFTPELYKFGINVVGVSDMTLLHKTMPRTWELARAQFTVMIGDPRKDRDEMRQWSPVNHIDKLQAPLLMAYGERDPRVVLEHAEILERELKKHNKVYEHMVFSDEGHGFRRYENQVKFYKAIDAFLAKYGPAANGVPRG